MIKHKHGGNIVPVARVHVHIIFHHNYEFCHKTY